MEDNKFNNYNLTNDEVSKILIDFENIIKSKASKLGKYKEDCEQEIEKKKKIKKILKNFPILVLYWNLSSRGEK